MPGNIVFPKGHVVQLGFNYQVNAVHLENLDDVAFMIRPQSFQELILMCMCRQETTHVDKAITQKYCTTCAF